MTIQKAVKLLEKGEVPPIKDLYKWINELIRYREDIKNGVLQKLSYHDL